MKRLEISANISIENSEDYFTGSWRKDIPVVKDKDELSRNPIIALFCPESAIKFINGKFINIDYRYCKGCGICAKELPNAIVMRKG